MDAQSSTRKSTKPDTHQMITDRIIADLESGTIPWRKPWNASTHTQPVNIRGTRYHGVNRMTLGFGSAYDCPIWMTFKQAQEHGGTVNRGEHGSPVVFWRFLDVTEHDEESGQDKERRIPMASYSTAFNLRQTSDVRVPENVAHLLGNQERPEPIAAADAIIEGYHGAPALHHGDSRAYYRPSTDSVHMPDSQHFVNVGAYYATLFHEFGHSTGHASRLARPGVTEPAMFGDHNYSREELVAEMCSAFLCADAGIDADASLISNTAAYIQSWLKVLAGDKRMVLTASSQAQKAADHITGTAEPRS